MTLAMLAALRRTLDQLGDRAHRGVLLRSLAGTLALFASLWWGVAALLARLDTTGWPGWLARLWSDADGFVALLLVAPLALLLFAGVATTIAGLFLDDIVDAVEAKHYPERHGKHLSAAANLQLALGAGLRVLVANLLALPVYLLLLFTGFGSLLLFLVLNAWLMGHEYMEMVAARHLPADKVKLWLAAHRRVRWQAGAITAACFAVPVLNLLAPLVGAGLATHLFHGAYEPEANTPA